MYDRARERLVKAANERGIELRQNYNRKSKHILAQQSRYTHAKQMKRARKCTRTFLADVNETASIVLEAKQTGGRSGVLIFGGGSPKNFVLQTEPQIQEILKIDEKGHDFFIQFTDARPDTGGLSGATPSEAVSWGKIDPDKLPDSIVAYVDSTIAMPILTSYALAHRKPRKLRQALSSAGCFE